MKRITKIEKKRGESHWKNGEPEGLETVWDESGKNYINFIIKMEN